MSTQQNNITDIPLDIIDDPQYAMRTEMDNDGLQDLAQSIRQVGLIEPIIVRRVGERYEVVAGHRRRVAASMAGLVTIRAVVSDAPEDELEVIKIHENFCRQDVDLVDEAFFIAQSLERLKMTPEQFGEMINRSTQYVKDRVEITGWDDYMIKYLREKRLKLGVAQVLSGIKDSSQRKLYVDQAAENGITINVARIWLNEALRGERTFVEVMEAASADAVHVPTREWTVDCTICSSPVGVKVARLVYAHQDCVDAISART